jgi:fatty-acid desaturase
MWWETDTTWLTIRLLAALGLAHDVITPSPSVLARANANRSS